MEIFCSMIHLIVPDTPLPAQSVRLGKWGAYNPRSQQKKSVQKLLSTQYLGEPMKGEFIVDMVFYFEPPKSVSEKKRKLMLENVIKHTVKPDRDNLSKFLNDCLQDVVIANDSMIWDGKLTKLWGVPARTEISIYQE